MDAAQRLKWAEGLLVAGGEGNLQLAVQDLKLLIRERLRDLERELAPGEPRAVPPLEASLQAHAILGDLDRLCPASGLEETLGVIERVEGFLRTWPAAS